MEIKKQVKCDSGAADEIGFLFGVEDQNVNRVYEAEHGISSGALIRFVKMCGDWDTVRELILTFNPKEHIFGYNPFSIKGLFIAIKSIRNKRYGLWQYLKLEKVLRSVTDKNKFDNYKGCPIWVGITDSNSKYINIRIDTIPYDEAIKRVIESASLQLLVDNSEGKGDGGLVNHIGSEFMAEKYNHCDVVSVFARTDHFCAKQPPISFKSISWLLKNMFFNISRNNETETDKICEKYGNKHYRYFMSRDVIEGFFNIKPEDNLELYEMGLKAKPIDFDSQKNRDVIID